MMSEDEIAATASIARASVKVPPFWRENPEIWFSQMESQFFFGRNNNGNHEISPRGFRITARRVRNSWRYTVKPSSSKAICRSLNQTVFTI
ncbi:hypothetical protein TNCV_2047571 [Trichonephila clavipes]|uniref:Uncharacterized protein n=1 Tax=Trichonephila clavipes TaxID=2585209 RepID=A0A8X6T1T3_TRICX|nr:hypothetical protein TNCV_2047571 [Trichonephila clavipes]